MLNMPVSTMAPWEALFGLTQMPSMGGWMFTRVSQARAMKLTRPCRCVPRMVWVHGRQNRFFWSSLTFMGGLPAITPGRKREKGRVACDRRSNGRVTARGERTTKKADWQKLMPPPFPGLARGQGQGHWSHRDGPGPTNRSGSGVWVSRFSTRVRVDQSR